MILFFGVRKQVTLFILFYQFKRYEKCPTYFEILLFFSVSGTKHGLWLSLAEWLLRKGARKLIIASLKQNLATRVSRKFNDFMSKHSATIMMTTITRLDTKKGAEEFIQEAVRMGPVGGIFCTFMVKVLLLSSAILSINECRN